jgi:hypothetical protein
MIIPPGSNIERLVLIDRFATMLVNQWRNKGATTRQINNELDNRILHCGRIIFNYYRANPEAFILSEFIFITLKYCYGILKLSGHLAPVNEVFYRYFRDEILQWKVQCKQPNRSGLTMAAMVLNLYAEVTQLGNPFIVNNG